MLPFCKSQVLQSVRNNAVNWIRLRLHAAQSEIFGAWIIMQLNKKRTSVLANVRGLRTRRGYTTQEATHLDVSRSSPHISDWIGNFLQGSSDRRQMAHLYELIHLISFTALPCGPGPSSRALVCPNSGHWHSDNRNKKNKNKGGEKNNTSLLRVKITHLQPTSMSPRQIGCFT